MGFADRWWAAVANLRLQTERLQATADILPICVCPTSEQQLSLDLHRPLAAHMAALSDYTTALACVQALLQAREPSDEQSSPK